MSRLVASPFGGSFARLGFPSSSRRFGRGPARLVLAPLLPGLLARAVVPAGVGALGAVR